MMQRYVVLCLLLTGVALGGTTSISGSFSADDPNAVFRYPFTLPSGGGLLVQSWGYGGGTNAAGAVVPAGGFDAYLSLFAGIGDSATFLASDDDSGCPPGAGDPNCRDPRLVVSGLLPGSYVVTLTTFGNISFAENYGVGTLGDGFVGLGSYWDADNFADRAPTYALDVTGELGPTGDVPEPALALPAGIAALALLIWRQRGSI